MRRRRLQRRDAGLHVAAVFHDPSHPYVMALAGASEVLVSSITRSLADGSGVELRNVSAAIEAVQVADANRDVIKNPDNIPLGRQIRIPRTALLAHLEKEALESSAVKAAG